MSDDLDAECASESILVAVRVRKLLGREAARATTETWAWDESRVWAKDTGDTGRYVSTPSYNTQKQNNLA